MTYTDSTKISTYKWRANNKQVYNAYQNKLMLVYYEKNKAAILQRKSESYRIRKEFRRFLDILIDP